MNFYSIMEKLGKDKFYIENFTGTSLTMSEDKFSALRSDNYAEMKKVAEDLRLVTNKDFRVVKNNWFIVRG